MLLMLVLGTALVGLELLRPGKIIPGVLGLLLLCVGFYRLPDAGSRALVVLAGVCFAAAFLNRVRLLSALAGAVLFAFGTAEVADAPFRVISAALFALLAARMSSLTARARENKVLDL